jgi:GntR family transcriptional regulator
MFGSREGDGIPKYVQLVGILKDRIVRQEYKPGEKIATEAELCVEHNVSRATVREAIDRLVRENLLHRQQGRGTFVVHQKLRRDIAKVYSFTADMLRLGLSPRSRVLELHVDESDPDTARQLKLPDSETRVLTIARVRFANDTPVLLETTTVPSYLCPGLIDNDFETGSLYQILAEKFQIVPHHAEETYEAVIMQKSEAELLGCDTRLPQPAFSIRRIAYVESGSPFELTRSVGRGDQLTLAINMMADKADFRRIIGP